MLVTRGALEGGDRPLVDIHAYTRDGRHYENRFLTGR